MKAYSANMVSANPKLAMHKDSHTISKLKPKIRIIHIVAPEIIKTDVDNFRELVQRLTGKPAKASPVPNGALSSDRFKTWPTNIMQQEDPEGIHRMKRDVKEESASNDLFGRLGDVDYDFIQDINDYPLCFLSSPLK